jgi:hypothetical protein
MPTTIVRRKRKKDTKVIHVNQLVIRGNAKRGENNPPLAIRTLSSSDKAVYGHEADLYLNGVKVGSFVYRPTTPLNCGAKVWFETDVLDIVPRLNDQEEK